MGQIEAAYLSLDAGLDAKMMQLAGAALHRVQGTQILNDQAYFLLCWGQLELEINERCRAAIRIRRNNPDWRIRRGWDLYNPDEKKLSGLAFENRVRLVLDQQAGKGNPFKRTMLHYEVRNKIAHGELRSTRVDVSAFVQDCYVIQSALNRAI